MTPAKAGQKNDFLATCAAALLMVCITATMLTYETIPAIQTVLSLFTAFMTFGILLITALLGPVKTIPLLVALGLVCLITVLLHISGESQQFQVLLRYTTSITGLFALHLAPIPDMRRYLAYLAMVVIGYAAYVALAGGDYTYAGTVRLLPVRAGITASALMISALTVLIALAPLKRSTKIIWIGVGLTLMGGYGVVTPMIMVAMFFGGWYFLRKGWSRVWLYGLGIVAVIGGIFFRNANSVRGADIDSLGAGAIGSGRVDAWIGRLQDFAERDIWTKLSGAGPYSDYQVSDIWHWEAKNAHSDMVTLLMEFGLIGFMFLFLAVAAIYRNGNKVQQLALIAMAFGAAASNSFLDRPLEAIGWGLALYACRYHSIIFIPVPERRKKRAPNELRLERAIQAP